MQSDALADRIGGLLLVGSPGAGAAPDTPPDIAETAGAILFERDAADASSAKALIGRLRGSGSMPRLVAVDQEGGTVARLRAFATPAPSAMALGAAGDEALTREMYALIGSEIAALGITLDLAPVADLNTQARNPVIGLRSFGDDPARVSGHVAAAIRGLHDAGVAAAAKHFPGHGDTAQDSHTALPVIAHDLAILRERELVPFRAAIDAGVDVVMAAHVAFPAIDASGVPATFSRVLLHDFLRGELGFEGVICTDAMEMGAIAGGFTPGDAAIRAIAAGADLLVYERAESAAPALAALREAVRSGVLDAQAVAQSLARIEALRARIAAWPRTQDATVIGSSEHRARAREAAGRAITLVRDPRKVLPFAPAHGDRIFVVNFGAQESAATKGAPVTSALGHALARGAGRVTEQLRSVDPAGHEYKQLLMAAGAATMFVAVTRRADEHPLQAQAVADLAMLGKPIVAVAAMEPYDAGVLPPNVAVIASYGDGDDALAAAADIVMGVGVAAGTLPVRVPEPQPAAASPWG